MSASTYVTLEGQDHPDIIFQTLQILNEEKLELLDISHSVTHGMLSLHLLLHSKQTSRLQEWAKEKKLKFNLRHLEDKQNHLQVSQRYILTCASPKQITPSFLAQVTQTLAQKKLHIHRIESNSKGSLKALEISITGTGPIDREDLKTQLMGLSHIHQTDMAFLEDDYFRFNKKLIVFDMDSTLIEAEVIDEMAIAHGVGDRVKEITVRAMNGELNFDQSLTERVALLKGMKRSKVEDILQGLRFTPGTEKFLLTVKKHGYRTAIVSGGFQYFADSIKQKLGMDYAFANELIWENNQLTGQVKHPILNAQKKSDILEELARKENLHLEQVVAIGDGANDLPMLAKAGLGIAFHAKEKVRKEARHQMAYGPMTSILYFLGIPGNHLDETL